MTDDSAFKKQVRARIEQTGEKYTVARRMVIAGRDPGQPPVALRVYLNPHVDLELAGEAARAYAAADEPGRRDMVNRLLADHIEVAGSGEAGAAAGSEILTVQALRIEEIGEVVRRRIGRAAGVSAVAVGGDLDHVRVDIEAARPGVVHGHGGAEAGRLRAELEELTGKPVLLNMLVKPGLQEGPGDAGSGRGRTLPETEYPAHTRNYKDPGRPIQLPDKHHSPFGKRALHLAERATAFPCFPAEHHPVELDALLVDGPQRHRRGVTGRGRDDIQGDEGVVAVAGLRPVDGRRRWCRRWPGGPRRRRAASGRLWISASTALCHRSRHSAGPRCWCGSHTAGSRVCTTSSGSSTGRRYAS